MELRDYQTEVIAKLRASIAQLPQGDRRVILQAETGSGKTVMASEMIRRAYERGKQSIFIARGREIVKQTVGTLSAFGVPAAVIMRGEFFDPAAPVQVCSKDTLASWIWRGKIKLPKADLVVIDECHESLAKGWLKMIDNYKDKVVVGLSATPARRDGKPLAPTYRDIVQAVPTSTLIQRGWLVPCKVFAPWRPNMKGAKIRAGEWTDEDKDRVMVKKQLVGDIVGHWKSRGAGRVTICFATNRRHAAMLCEEFRANGYRAEYLDGETELEQRDQIIGRANNANLDVICCVDVLNQGVDIPVASCAILASPTRSLVRYRQRIGRIKRPYAEKENCLVLDHSGACYDLGMPDDDIEWELTEGCNVNDRQREKIKTQEPLSCPRCCCLYRGPVCPECGYETVKRHKEIKSTNGSLVEVTGTTSMSRMAKQRIWDAALATASRRGAKVTMALAIYRSKVGEWPKGLKRVPDFADRHMPVHELFPGFARGRSRVG